MPILLACTVVDRSHEAGPNLVPEDAPIDDPTFRDLTPKDLDLARLWTEARPGTDDSLPLDRYTVADLVERVSPAVVNLYTTSIEAREARVGIHPNELLPFRLPIV